MVASALVIALLDVALKDPDRLVTGASGDLLTIGSVGIFTNRETLITNSINIACYAAIAAKIHVSSGK